MMQEVTQSNEDEICREACTDPVNFLRSQWRNTEKATLAVLHLRDFRDHQTLQNIIEDEYEPLVNRHLALVECYEGDIYKCRNDYAYLEGIALNPESPRSLAVAATRYMLQVFYDEVPSGTLQYIAKHGGEFDQGETEADKANNKLFKQWIAQRFPELIGSELITIEGPVTLAPLRYEDKENEDLDFTKVQLASPINSDEKVLRGIVGSILDEALEEGARTLASTILRSRINPRHNPEYRSLVEEDLSEIISIFEDDGNAPLFTESFRFAIAKSIGCIYGSAPFAAAALCGKIAESDPSIAVKEGARLSFVDLCDRIQRQYPTWFENPKHAEREYSDAAIEALEGIRTFLYLRDDSSSFLNA